LFDNRFSTCYSVLGSRGKEKQMTQTQTHQDRFDSSITFTKDGTASICIGYSCHSKVSVEHRTEHYVVIRSKGGSYWNRGNQYVQGNIEIREYKGGTMSKAFYREYVDRTWRTQVKAAIAEADRTEANWEKMNSSREAAKVAAVEAAQAAEKYRTEVERMVACIASSSEMTEAFAQFKDIISTMADVEVKPEDVSRIIQRAVVEVAKQQ
jgi:hypothetical protein